MTLKEAVEYLEQRISWASLKGDYDIFIQGRRADDLLAMLKYLDEKQNLEKDTVTWICHLYRYGTKRFECSWCHGTSWKDSEYCPHCGTRMDGMVSTDD